MTDERLVQENAADRRQGDVVREAQDVRTRVLQGLDALDRELQRVRREAEGIPPLPPLRKPRRGWLPWG
jgi:hypothetical protein